jgi:hypothetical protein
MANPTTVTAAAVISEVINSFLLFKIKAFKSGHVNLIVSPSKMALTLLRLRWNSSGNRASLMPTRKPAQVPSRC